MFRRKPPQLSLYDELQQTYNDVCNLTVKNLTLEEQCSFEDLLKGWKSLHTLLLFKTEVFEKQQSKLSADEARILQELRNIRDENVKHLIRVQLRIDEMKRRQQKPQRTAPAPANSRLKNMLVPSLRNAQAPASRSLTNGSQRQMLKLLRPGAHTNGSKMLAAGAAASKTAASVLWTRPAKRQSPVPAPEDEVFGDFDQDLFDFTDSNWERVSDGLNEQPNLIDLEDDRKQQFHSIPALFAPETGNSLSKGMVKSMEDLSVIASRKKPPPPPPPRINRLPSHSALPPPTQMASSAQVAPSNQHHSTQNAPTSQQLQLAHNSHMSALSLPPSQLLQSPQKEQRSSHRSRSTPDVHLAEQTPKKYVYNKPKPLNINQLMNPLKTPPKATPVKTQSQVPRQARKPATNAVNATKKSNISYNYVLAPKAKLNNRPVGSKIAKKPVLVPPEAPEAPLSPTMDDILTGYDEDAPFEQETQGIQAPTSEAEQEKFIKSIRGIDPTAAKQILTDIVVHGDEVYWDDIVGLEGAKNSLKEAVVYPFLRPDLFRGLREPTRGMLLFGPPGTGKTMLARAVATESKSTFFSISLSSLTSKYLGESEKLVKALFLLAKKLSPSIVFIDEIDSLLSARTEGEVELTRRIKNEFLVQWSELSSAAAGRDQDGNDVSRVLILGATNLPWSIDEAARRRFVKRQYIPLPEAETRKTQVKKLLLYQKHTLLDGDFDQLQGLTAGFSGSDITALAKDSAMGPLRSLGDKLLLTPTEEIRAINLDDFKQSLLYIRPSVSAEGLEEYEKWAVKFGSLGA